MKNPDASLSILRKSRLRQAGRPCRAILALMFFAGSALSSRTILAEPDEVELGKADGYPRGTAATMFAERFKVGSFTRNR